MYNWYPSTFYLSYGVSFNLEPSEKVHCIQIRAGDRGYGYETLIRDCLDDNVEWVELDDPYIRARHQVRNFVQFCELMVKRCKRLRQITLTTGTDSSPAGGDVSFIPDSQVVTSDSQVVTSDSQVVTSDIHVVTPDSQVVTSDSQVITSDSQVITSDGRIRCYSHHL